MISGIFHSGSGLGNQLFRYVATRVLVADKGYRLGYEFGMVAPELFKGRGFMSLDMGKDCAYRYEVETPSGKTIPRHQYEITNIPVWEEWSKFCYDPDINFVEDSTIIDGSFEDPRYFEHRLDEIDQWLKVEPLEMPDDLCVIGFRGGEYIGVPELFLPREYWQKAISEMVQNHPGIRFEVHTDDPETARKFFPIYPIIHNVGINWRSMRYAKYAIIANSSFFVLPRLLSAGLTIAPRFWNRYNTKKWDYPQSYYKQFSYIHHEM